MRSSEERKAESCMAKKAYIITLCFGAWQNQLWFSGDDDELSEIRWVDAKKSLQSLGDCCSNANEFFLAAVKHFAEYGFTRIQK